MTTRVRFSVLLAAILVLSGAHPSVCLSAPQSMTRDEIIDLARSGVGYSYWWGHGCWRQDDTQHGSCSGSCPDCTHYGSFGADCSGFAAKVWQVPDPSPLTTNTHPYSTQTFRYGTDHWSQVSRSDAQSADCFVYRNDTNTAGHIVVHDSGDPWGQPWVYEARGCSYGIVHNLKSLGSSYVAIRRDSLSTCNADCSGRTCGPDPVCGQSCGSCSHGFFCNDGGQCEEIPCFPDCTNRLCGPDPVCGESCGTCPDDTACNQEGLCEHNGCVPECGSRKCGTDPVCGFPCGTCPFGTTCNASFQCEEQGCVPNCNGIECGPDPRCEISCGECESGMECNINGRCVEEGSVCYPDCSGLDCGRDPVCGRNCGICAPEQFCSETGRCQPIGPGDAKLHGHVVEVENRGQDANLYYCDSVGNATVRTGRGDLTTALDNGYYEMMIDPGVVEVYATADGFEEGMATCAVEAGQANECFVPVYRPGTVDDQDKPGGCACHTSGRHHPLCLPFLLVFLLRLGITGIKWNRPEP